MDALHIEPLEGNVVERSQHRLRKADVEVDVPLEAAEDVPGEDLEVVERIREAYVGNDLVRVCLHPLVT